MNITIKTKGVNSLNRYKRDLVEEGFKSKYKRILTKVFNIQIQGLLILVRIEVFSLGNVVNLEVIGIKMLIITKQSSLQGN